MEGNNIQGAHVNITETKEARGWGLLDIDANCQATLLGRLWIQSTREGSATATWLQEWNLAGLREKPTARSEDTDETNVLTLLCARHDIHVHNTPW